jgi:MoaA/NifB/PqqE/SkfB family radical SAM enzyme
MPTTFSVTYRDGWYPLEHDGTRPFRWTTSRAHVAIVAEAECRSAWLRLACGVWGAAPAPLLAVAVDGRRVGCARVNPYLGYVSFPLGPGRRFDVDLQPDSTFSVPGDGRALGVMVKGLEVFDEDDLDRWLELEGWYEREEHEYFPFSWMGAEARVLVPALARPGARFAAMPIAADTDGGRQRLAVHHGGRQVAELPLRRGWHVYDVELPAETGDAGDLGGERAVLALHLNALCPREAHPDDPRPLGVRVGPIEVHGDGRRHAYVRGFHDGWPAGPSLPPAPAAAAETTDVCCGLPAIGDGWHLDERDERGTFRWTRREARLRVSARRRGVRRFASLPLFSAYRNLAQRLTVLAEGGEVARFDLARGWHTYSLALPPPGGDLDLDLRLNVVTPMGSHPHDPRELGIRVGALTLHDDEGRHARETFLAANAVCSQREMQRGAVTLESFPQTLGIDLYGKCNIKPPCVYCLWDSTKALEGEAVNEVVDDRTLEGYGGLFQGARLLVNCSFGEPLLHPRLGRVLDLAAATGKVMELSSNGQAFTPRSVQLLAGRRVHLYVSLDAATAATYGRLRNERWDEVLTALLFLRDAREASGGWPRLNMVFMPMPANLGDLEAYFKLCRLVEADQLVLRPLLYLERPAIVRDRGEYRFDYERELMTPAALEPVFEACERYAAKYEVQVVSQFDFGLDEASRFHQADGTREGS